MLVGLSHPRTAPCSSTAVYDALGMCTVWLPNARCMSTDSRNVFNLPGLDKGGRLAFARSALEVAARLHELGLAHRDIKFDNVLIVLARHSPPCALFIDFAAACTQHVASEASCAMDRDWQQALSFLPKEDLLVPVTSLASPLLPFFPAHPAFSQPRLLPLRLIAPPANLPDS